MENLININVEYERGNYSAWYEDKRGICATTASSIEELYHNMIESIEMLAGKIDTNKMVFNFIDEEK